MFFSVCVCVCGRAGGRACRASPFALNVNNETPLLMAEGNWRAVSRPPAAIDPVDPARPTWEDPERGTPPPHPAAPRRRHHH